MVLVIFRLNNEYLFPDPEPPIINDLLRWSGIYHLFGLCSFMFLLFSLIKAYNFLYCFIILLHLISSFLNTRSLLVLYAHVSTELIDCIPLPSIELTGILSVSSLETLCLSLRNVCCIFNIIVLYFINVLKIFSKKIHVQIIFS